VSAVSQFNDVLVNVQVISKAEVSQEGEEGEDEDWGDWFDDFVVEAAKDVPGTTIIEENREDGLEDGGKGECRDDDEDDEGSEDDSAEERSGLGTATGSDRKGVDAGGMSASKAGYAHSIASSYWRSERQDRKGHLGGLDECFETLATQVRYNRRDYKAVCIDVRFR
jgi:hypothetical protein